MRPIGETRLSRGEQANFPKKRFRDSRISKTGFSLAFSVFFGYLTRYSDPNSISARISYEDGLWSWVDCLPHRRQFYQPIFLWGPPALEDRAFCVGRHGRAAAKIGRGRLPLFGARCVHDGNVRQKGAASTRALSLVGAVRSAHVDAPRGLQPAKTPRVPRLRALRVTRPGAC